jgi:putative membrane protein
MRLASRNIIAALFVVTMVGCTDDGDDGVFDNDHNPATGDADGGVGCVGYDAGAGDAGLDGGAEQGDVTDAQSAGVMLVANMGEVEQGLLCLALGQRGDVRAFAQRMVDEHTATLTRQATLLRGLDVRPAETRTSETLRQKSERTVTSLSREDATAFDLAYVNAQVQAHTEVLAQLNDRLIPQADNAAWKADLEATRAAVRQHLEMAKALKAKLGSTDDAGADGGATGDDGGAAGDAGTDAGGNAGADAGSDGG